MVVLRSRRMTGNDLTMFCPYKGGPSGPSCSKEHLSSVYPMVVVQCAQHLGQAEDDKWPPFLAYVRWDFAFSGEGDTFQEAVENTCRKLSSFIEAEFRAGRARCGRGCGGWGKYEVKRMERMLEEQSEQLSSFTYTCIGFYRVFAEFDPARAQIIQVGWYDEEEREWNLRKIPKLACLAMTNKGKRAKVEEEDGSEQLDTELVCSIHKLEKGGTTRR